MKASRVILSAFLAAAPAVAWADGAAPAAAVPPVCQSAPYAAPYALTLMEWTGGAIALASLILLVVLSRSGFSLKDCLKEPGSDPSPAMDGKDGNTSASRLIALMASVYLLIMFVAVGLAGIGQFPCTGADGEVFKQFGNYFWTGLALFAPYVANKFSNLFKS